MIPLMLLASACFSDVTHRQGCDQLQTANLKYYKIDVYGENGKKFLESQVGKTVFVITTTAGYTLYKKEFNYHFSNYGLKLTNSEAFANIRFGW